MVDAESLAAEDAPEAQKMELGVSIKEPSACERHITVTIPREDVDRYFDDAVKDMMPKAEVPGFRAGRAPRKLVESRFRSDLAPQVKGSLLIDSITQVNEDEKLAVISEPDFDVEAVEIPEEGPLVFEYKIEVRPNFDLPDWKGLKLKRPVREFSDDDIRKRKEQILAERGTLSPKDGPVEAGDYVVVNLKFSDGGNELSHSEEETIRVRPVLSFRDGRVEKFDELLKGAKAGETRVGKAQLSADAPNPALRGKEVDASFEVLEVKQLELPEMTPALLDELGGFEDEKELDDFIRDDLNRQFEYHQTQQIRGQVVEKLLKGADWELPPDLLRRQAQRELQRSVMELQRNGFTDAEIRAHANELRQNTLASTEKSLKEHFILERIAEEESIEEQPSDFDDEIELIARQSGESPRRVRAPAGKTGSNGRIGQPNSRATRVEDDLRARRV